MACIALRMNRQNYMPNWGPTWLSKHSSIALRINRHNRGMPPWAPTWLNKHSSIAFKLKCKYNHNVASIALRMTRQNRMPPWAPTWLSNYSSIAFPMNGRNQDISHWARTWLSKHSSIAQSAEGSTKIKYKPDSKFIFQTSSYLFTWSLKKIMVLKYK